MGQKTMRDTDTPHISTDPATLRALLKKWKSNEPMRDDWDPGDMVDVTNMLDEMADLYDALATIDALTQPQEAGS
jgi:hypothetical protein